jgi:hypothetical protein
MPPRPQISGGFLPRRSQRIAEQKKKKCLKNFTRQMPTVFDEFPMFVIECHIFPYLDYQTRISLNQCLPQWDRIQTKMNPKSIQKHQINYCVNVVASMLSSLEAKSSTAWNAPWLYQGDRRIQRMIEMLSLFLKDEYFAIYTNFGHFRAAFSAKIDDMQALANQYNNLYSRVWLDELISMCNTLRDKILNYKGGLTTISLNKIPSLNFT